MKAGDVRAMTPDQLDDELMKLKKEQFNLRFQRATGQLENTGARARTCAATSRASRPSPRRSAPPKSRSEEN